MKAITLWQPWASLLALGLKHETRSWGTSYRGQMAIHAAKRTFEPMDFAIFDPIFAKAVTDALKEAQMSIHRLPFGEVLALGDLVKCYKILGVYTPEQSKGHLVTVEDGDIIRDIWITSDDLLFGDWTPGRFAWEFINMKMLDKPVPAQGGQRIWNWNYR